MLTAYKLAQAGAKVLVLEAGPPVNRQEALATPHQDGGALMTFEAQAIAPFTTGLGNEHPLENGFAFLSPYGVPYLPGSGVKGVLRQAARELVSGKWGEIAGWSAERSFTPAISSARSTS